MGARTAAPAKPELFVLMGFMGAGKSTVGRLLATRLQWKFIDVDAYIETQEQATIAELFERHGENAFRGIESKAIRRLSSERDVVLALGGGAVETAETRQVLEQLQAACLVFLDAPLEIMLERCRQQPGAAIRPLLQQQALLEARLTRRLPHYRNSHLIIATEGLTPDQVVDRILAWRNPDQTVSAGKESIKA